MKRILVLLLVLAMLVSVVGCSQSNDVPDNTASTDADNENAEEELPKSGGTINYCITGEPTTLFAWEARKPNDLAVMHTVSEYLFRFDENGSPQPYLVESYETDADALTYTFKIREGIKFHDGSDLDAETVAWNLNMYKEQGVLTGSFFGFMDNAEVVDDMTVVVNMNAWDSLFPVALARTCFITSKAAYDTNGEEYLKSNPVGTGPFMFTNWEHDVSLSVERFDDYWQGTPYLDGIEFNIYAESLVAATALEAGELDIVNVTVFDIASDLQTKEGVDVQTAALTGTGYTLCYMCTNEDDPLNDIRVRQAISYAIDTQSIAETSTQGFYFDSNQWCTQSSPYYSEDVTGHPYDVEKAKELLADAGYADGFDTRITLHSNYLEDGAQIIAQQLAEIGINCELNVTEGANYGAHIANWEYGMLLHPMGTSNGQASQLAANFKQGLESGLGISAFVIPDELNDLVLEAVAASEDEANEKYQEIAYMVFEELDLCKVIVLSQNIIATTDNLKGGGTWLTSNLFDGWHKLWLDE